MTFEQFVASKTKIAPLVAFKNGYGVDDNAVAVLNYGGTGASFVIEDLGEDQEQRYMLCLPGASDERSADLGYLERQLYEFAAAECGWKPLPVLPASPLLELLKAIEDGEVPIKSFQTAAGTSVVYLAAKPLNNRWLLLMNDNASYFGDLDTVLERILEVEAGGL